MLGEWLRKPTGATSVVFVHGILSSGETCWRHANGNYWPELLKQELDLTSLGIYVYTYQTGFTSGTYSLSNVVDDLKERFFKLDGIADSNKVVFVCHSMGGIVVRKLIVERVNDFLDRNIEVGLYLIASPSLGSEYAKWLELIAQFAGHEQAKALKFSQDNQWLNDLDRSFINLKESNRLKIYGKELLEDKFVTLKRFWRKQVVEPFSGNRYFGESLKVAGSDHFSIAKPQDKEADQHRLLLKFIKKLGYSQAPTKSLTEQNDVDSKIFTLKVSKTSISGDDTFICKVRDQIKRILATSKPAALTLREALLKNQPPDFAPEEVLIPNHGSVSPESAIRKWRNTVQATLEQARDNRAEIKQCASDIMGWLILLCVDGNRLQQDGASFIDMDKATEIVIPVKTQAGIEVFVARLQERSAKFQLKGTDKALGEGYVDPADLELGLLKPDCLLEIKKLVYIQVFKKEPSLSEDWLRRLRYTLEFDFEDRNKMYYLSLSRTRQTELVDMIKQLKVDLPHLRILITGTSDSGGDYSILIMDESRLEALVLAFLTTLVQFP